MTQTTGRGPERIGPGSTEPESPDVRSAAAIPGPRPDPVNSTVSGTLTSAVTSTGPAGAPPLGRFDRLRHRLARPGGAEVLLAVLSALVFSWRVQKPSPWWDEAITRDVTSRSASQIVDLAQHVDLVHTSYYLLVHAVLGSSATVTPIRMLSVVAAALTTALLVWLGRELGSARVGIVAALMWTAAPLVTRYAQEARPYAMVALATTAATLALVRACRKPWQRRRWLIYTATLVAVGLLNVLALLILLVHLIHVLSTEGPALRRRWYLHAGAALVLLSPLLIASGRQKDQVDWLPRPALDRLTGFLAVEYASTITLLLILLIAIVGLGRGTHKPALALGLSWAVVPTVVLWTVSQLHPLFDWRYVFFTVPGTVLALASIATLLRWRWIVAALLVLALGGLHMQNVYRYTASGHGENIRGVAQVIAEKAEPGDAVLFLPASRRVVSLAFPEDFRGVDDVALAGSGEQTATLWGVEEPTDEIMASLHGRNRVWVVTGAKRSGELLSDPGDEEKEQILYNSYRLAGVTFVNRYEVRLYERNSVPIVPVSGTSS